MSCHCHQWVCNDCLKAYDGGKYESLTIGGIGISLNCYSCGVMKTRNDMELISTIGAQTIKQRFMQEHTERKET